ncbi:MAG: hypothetical protein WCG84_01175 [Candidatus Moraniibacteriota bacterium]
MYSLYDALSGRRNGWLEEGKVTHQQAWQFGLMEWLVFSATAVRVPQKQTQNLLL